VASHLDPFIASLIEQQYRASVICIKARHGLALDRWLAKRRVALADLGEAQIEYGLCAARMAFSPLASGPTPVGT
jgi:hypothetical protein